MILDFGAYQGSDVCRFPRPTVGQELMSAADGIVETPKGRIVSIRYEKNQQERVSPSPISPTRGVSGSTAQVLSFSIERLLAYFAYVPRSQSGMCLLAKATATLHLPAHRASSYGYSMLFST
jgi:hypothetical protein